jgi:hypothetical protein
MTYEHPVYTPESVAAQRRHRELMPAVTAFAGAYHGWRFHEDGCRSGVEAAAALGVSWRPLTPPSTRALSLTCAGHSSTTLAAARGAIAPLLTEATECYPWTGWSFSAGRGVNQTRDVTLVEPDLVGEVSVDVARDTAGRWRHPVRWHRARTDMRN